jgi:hypothetical protein
MRPFDFIRFKLAQRRADVLAAPNASLKVWHFPKSVCYAGRLCPLTAPNGATYWEEMMIHLALYGSRGFLYFNPWYDYAPGAGEGRVTMADHRALSAVLHELDRVVGCAGAAYVPDPYLRWQDGFLLAGMDVEGGRVWRLTLEATANSSAASPHQLRAHDRVVPPPTATGHRVNISGVLVHLGPSRTPQRCSLIFDRARVLPRSESVSALGLWVVVGDRGTLSTESGVWLECPHAGVLHWPTGRGAPAVALPPPLPARWTCVDGACLEYAKGNFSSAAGCNQGCTPTATSA